MLKSNLYNVKSDFKVNDKFFTFQLKYLEFS